MDKIDFALTGILLVWGLGWCAVGVLFGYRSCEKYWVGRDKWYKAAESITEQMAQDGWNRP